MHDYTTTFVCVRLVISYEIPLDLPAHTCIYSLDTNDRYFLFQKAYRHQRKTLYNDHDEWHIVPESKPDKDTYFFRAGAMLGTDPNLWVTFGENDHIITQIVPRWPTEPIFPETKEQCEQWRA